MRTCLLMLLLVVSPLVRAQAWTPWEVSASFTKDAEGFPSFRTLTGKDAAGGQWQILWNPDSVVVVSPDGSRKSLGSGFPVEAHPQGAMSIGSSGIERWLNRGWECYRVRLDTGRNGIGLEHYLVVVVDRRSGAWAVCTGRVAGESMEDPSLMGEALTLRWCDEDKRRPLRVWQEWRADRTAKALRVTEPPAVFQLEYGYPVWFRFWSDVRSPDPDIAEHQGWLSISWRVARVEASGGVAESTRDAIPKVPGKQVWQRGTGPDIWFPAKGTVTFRWAGTVEARRFSRPVESMTPENAAQLASQGGWDIVLTRDHQGDYLGTMLVERP